RNERSLRRGMAADMDVRRRDDADAAECRPIRSAVRGHRGSPRPRPSTSDWEVPPRSAAAMAVSAWAIAWNQHGLAQGEGAGKHQRDDNEGVGGATDYGEDVGDPWRVWRKVSAGPVCRASAVATGQHSGRTWFRSGGGFSPMTSESPDP